MSNKILIPTFVEAKLFENLEINGVEKALRECYGAKCEPVYMPQLVDARISAPNDSPVWQWHATPSVRVTGRTKPSTSTVKGGNPVVVYAHVPNYFSKPNNVAKAVSEGLTNGAGRMPPKEFYTLLSLEDNEKVFVVDYTTLKNSSSKVIDVAQALEHPQVIPFLGGQTRTEQYLEKFQQVYNSTKIGVWHCDDLTDEPLGRVLFLGYDHSDDLIANDYLSNSGRFLGVRRGVGVGSVARENPGLDAVMKSVKSALEPMYR